MHLPGSVQVTPDPSNPSVVPDASKPPSPPSPNGSLPLDQAEPSQDSSVQLQPQEESSLEVQSVECDTYVSGALDITLEGGAQVSMDRAIVEWLCGEAAKGVALWDDCLSHMTVNEHPRCEYPHVYGVECDVWYYIKTEVLDYKENYDEFHNLLLCNDLMAEVVRLTDPFVVHHIVARLLHDDHTLPVELLPSLEASLCSHRHVLTARRDSLRECVKNMDQKLHQISLEEAAPPAPIIASGSMVPPRRDSDSSHQSEGAEWPNSSLTASEEVEPKLPPGPIKLEDQLHLPFADHLALDCGDYPWEHPPPCASSFRAPRQFGKDGLWIPIWF